MLSTSTAGPGAAAAARTQGRAASSTHPVPRTAGPAALGELHSAETGSLRAQLRTGMETDAVTSAGWEVGRGKRRSFPRTANGSSCKPSAQH